jgi:hypothetical protein
MASTFIHLPEDTAVAAGVQSFNGRTGVVTGASGDYGASQISYNNTTSGLPATNVQTAIDAVKSLILTSASPGFSFGRAGIVNAGTYLQCETVPSNVAGRWVYITSAVVKRVFVSNEFAVPYTIEVLYSDGNNVNEVSLGTVTVSSGFGAAFTVNWAVPTNKQISVKVALSSSNAAKNIVCGLELGGST